MVHYIFNHSYLELCYAPFHLQFPASLMFVVLHFSLLLLEFPDHINTSPVFKVEDLSPY